jgi:hypothetical protein
MRCTVLSQLTFSSLFLPSRGDMHFYDDWARRLLTGQWTNHLAFYGLPGYAYLLALIYKIFGYAPFVPLLIQAALDAGTATLIFATTGHVFPRCDNRVKQTAGILAAAGWAFFVPAQTYAAILMPTTWVVFAFWFVLWRIVRTTEPPSTGWTFALGLLIGFAATAIATILFLIPVLAAAIWFRQSTGERRAFPGCLLATALLLVGVIAGTSPCWAHNFFVARDRVFLSAHSGVNLWIGNNPTANGYPHFPPGLRAGQAAMLQDSIEAAEEAAGHSLKRSEVSSFWSAKARAYITSDPAGWLRLLGRKLRNFWNAFQYDDLSVITNLREERVTLPGIYFGFVAALALPALLTSWKREPRSRWITAGITLEMLALLPVFTTERYRLPAVPGLLIFAAIGLIKFATDVSAKKLAPALSYAGLLAIATAFVSWPVREPKLWALDAYNSGWQALESGNLDLAERKLQLARGYVPHNAEVNFALGNLKVAQHEQRDAAQFYIATLQLDRYHGGALNNLGVLALENGNSNVAEHWFRQALAINESNAKTHFLLAKTLFAKGDRESARGEIQRALALAPNQPEFRSFAERITR